ncbi:hypothetical protein MRX96_021207 [Rhipicephalus microplus]
MVQHFGAASHIPVVRLETYLETRLWDVVDIDGVPTEVFPIVDDLDLILLAGDTELYVTADGRTLRVVCTSGQLAITDSTNGSDTYTTAQDHRRRKWPLQQLPRASS